MKKAGRIVSYLLVLALVTTLLSGLGYVKSEAVGVEAAGSTFTVVEIVPADNMATFGYFVKSWTDANYATRVNSITSDTTKFNKFNTYLNKAGCGTFNTTTNKFDSEDLFRKSVFGASDTRTINVIVKTPADSDLISTVNSADFIVINQSVPSDLRIGDQKTFNSSGCQLSNAQALAIFKKIAGVGGQTPVPYIIDFALMGRESLDDVRDHNSAFSRFSNKDGALFGYLNANRLYNGDQGIGEGQGVALKYGTDDHLYYGTDSTAYKLYKLLSAIDPSTLYGLYFQETDGSYGIDQNLSQIVNGPDTKGDGSDGEASLYCLNTKLSYWSDLAFRPYYLSADDRSISSVMSTMGWTEDVTSSDASHTLKNNTVSDFCKTVGGGDGRGLVFSSKKGLFSIIKGSAGAGGLDWESVSSSEVAITSPDQGNKEGNTYKNVKFNLDKKNDGTYANWKFSFSLSGVTGVTNGGTVSGNTVTFQGTNLNKGNNERLFDLTVSGSVSKTDIKNAILNGTVEVAAAPSAGGTNNTDKLKKVIAKTISIDYHPYRILMISENLPDKYANRTVVADLVAAANESGKSLAGGVVVDCVSKPQFDNISVNLDQTYDMICKVGGDSSVGSIGSSKLLGYHGVVKSLNKDDSGSLSSVKSTFKSDVLGKKFGVDFITVPALYYTDFVAFFNGENGWGSYMGSGNTTVAGNKNYINDDNNSGKRDLDFQFKVSGASSYSADLYVDVDGDFKYEDDEKVALTVNNANNNTNSIPLSHDKFFGEGGKDYVGGFSWKIVIKSGSDYVSKIGYSAIRNETTNKNVIKILQIYPTDYTSEFDQEERPHPMLLLPTKDEIKTAKDSSRGAISTYSINTLSGTKGVNALKTYFDGIIKIDRATGYSTTDGKVSGISTDQDIPNSGKEASVIYNSSFLYYFLDQLQDYDIDVTRYSVNGFNDAAKNKNILLDTETGRLAMSGSSGGQERNLDGSLKYSYRASEDLHFSDDSWKSETVTWTEGIYKKYLVVEGTDDLIYGERGTNDGQVTYYGATHPNGSTGAGVYKVDKDNEFDLLMIGFGDSLDYMNNEGVGLLKNYLKAGGPAFVGNGAVSTAGACNTFGNDTEIRSLLGISFSDTNGYSYSANAVHPLIVTNDTIFSHYPYTINRSMKASGDRKQPYRLSLSGSVDDPIVAFAKYSKNISSIGTWADAYENYYVYKKNNIVFCGFGNTFNDAEMKQQGAVLPMAETLMIVNALVASSRFGSSPIHSDPYIDCKDDDCSVLDVTGLEDDQVETNSVGDTIWYFKDSVYTDYDAYDIAAFYTDSTQHTFNKPVANSGLSIPGVTVTDDAWKTNIRWIRYEANLPTEAGGYMEFKTITGTRLNLKVWSVTESAWLTQEDGKYHVTRNGIYYIGVPLNGNHTAYSGATGVKLGFMIDKDTPANSIDMFAIRLNLYKSDKSNMLERHTLSMIRRVLYHVK